MAYLHPPKSINHDVCQAEAVRKPMLTLLLDDVDRSIADLHGNLDRVSARLESVMHPEAPQDSKECPTPRPPHPPALSHLDAHLQAVQAANRRLCSILDRLET